MHADMPDKRKSISKQTCGSRLAPQRLNEYHEPIRSFTRSPAQGLSRPVQANTFVVPPESPGFRPRFEVRDAFVVQAGDSSEWTVRELRHG
jgi:hypothetical protein